ncbi:hypothetical protein BS78_06G068500 [Paspalum vaginatum]|nr:hypothetical protein BS78_06G068500 [Paspalum vaginatum]KAJ1270653.1 hypothetical protein BS78_06G068500 [Paspalum vaginatum]KAJ1270654.1 hypothetical protein BS78_06G068500 [Paspalum vaginatum]KAJ1270655.1 hypothetical protein BS78_06G068500 [Paspalum vaginatum]KAJ1270656.1 hypothetical protein BS78_06G068500 [Paspalum vaginatum]
MEKSVPTVVRHVRCPKCLCVLLEPPNVVVYRCGGCGTHLRAKNRTHSIAEVADASSSSSSVFGSITDATVNSDQETETTTNSGQETETAANNGQETDIRRRSRRECVEAVLARYFDSNQVLPIEEWGHDQSANQGVPDNSKTLKQGDAGETAAQQQSSDCGEPAPISAQAKAVDELKGCLSEILSKFPKPNPRLPKQEGYYMSVTAMASGLATRARHASAGTVDHRGSTARLFMTREQEPSAPQKQLAAKDEAKWCLPPRYQCRPVLKGAPFIICSSCYELLQIPVGFTISTQTVRKLRCGSCSEVLTYAYRDPARKSANLVTLIESKGHDQNANWGASGNSKDRDAERTGTSPCVSVHLPKGSKDFTSELHNKTKYSKSDTELPNATRMHHSVESAAQLQSSDLEEPGPKSLLRGGNQLKQIRLYGSHNTLPPPKDVLHSSSDLPIYSTFQVEETHSTPFKDVMAWFAMGKQRRKGLNHTCMQQAGHKIVGRDDIRQKIMEKVLSGRNGGSNCTSICINGGSGLGKTSLLRVLYNDQELMDAFDERIWIQIPDKLDIVMLFRKIIGFSTNDHCSIMNTDLLQELVMEEIKDKKFLLFLDDADTEDQQFWNSAYEFLNAGAKGSVVIMATRTCDIAALRDVTHVYSLNPLSLENNLTIFQQHSDVGTDIQSNPNLTMIAKRFISMFGANPLNLKAICGLLCHADTISLDKHKFEGSDVTPLQLCHDVLPIHLKRCIAFCSLFPRGYVFDKHHMVIQWISHGCVWPVQGCDPEDVGIEYFNELMCRSFFQYSPIHNDKDDKFVMHELVYKVVESASGDEYFKFEDPMCSIPENILHLSVVSSQFETVELMQQTEELKDLQTFLAVQPEGKLSSISFPRLNLVGLDDFLLKFTSLEMLDLSHTDVEFFPGSIVDLRNLQYLSVNNTKIRALPSGLCSLINLQTLEARHCRFLTELPGDTKKLAKLRHLDVTKELDRVHLPHGVGQLTELRTLPVFHASSDSSHCSISELGSLHNLRGCLWLSGLESVKAGSKAQEANLKDKHRLQDLTLQWHDGGGVDGDEAGCVVAEQVLESLQPHADLRELAIRGYEGSTFPGWMQQPSSLPSLVSLTLDGCCNCTQFPAMIAHLPSLKFLSVRKMYDVQRLISRDIHGLIKFPSLELLNLWEMYGLEELFEASQGDCPRLRKVCISRCPDLKRLPCTPSVTELVLHCCHKLPDIPGLLNLASLKIEGFHGVRSFSLPAPTALPVLRKLEIRSCKLLSSVDGLSALTTVRRLKIAGCPKLVLPPSISGLAA